MKKSLQSLSFQLQPGAFTLLKKLSNYLCLAVNNSELSYNTVATLFEKAMDVASTGNPLATLLVESLSPVIAHHLETCTVERLWQSHNGVKSLQAPLSALMVENTTNSSFAVNLEDCLTLYERSEVLQIKNAMICIAGTLLSDRADLLDGIPTSELRMVWNMLESACRDDQVSNTNLPPNATLI